MLFVSDYDSPATLGKLGNGNGRGVEVTVKRGDSLIEDENIPSPSIMKIDVTGEEKQVVEGFGNTLDSCRLLYIEVHNPPNYSLRDFLEEKGFNVSVMPFYHGYDVEMLRCEKR